MINQLTKIARPAARFVRSRWDRLGYPQPTQRVVADAAAYWSDPTEPRWQANSHWLEGLPGHWEAVGQESLAITQRLVRVTGRALPSARTVEWGAGGGANAVVFAPLCDEFVAVDVVQASLDECASQVSTVCSTPVRTMLVDLAEPEQVVPILGRASCELFLCFYVFELLPGKDYAERVLRIAEELLTPEGVAVVQVKYATSDMSTWSRRRAYRRCLASMTTFGIDEFWLLAAKVGLVPNAVELVPKNGLDERYAYFVLTKSPDGGHRRVPGVGGA